MWVQKQEEEEWNDVTEVQNERMIILKTFIKSSYKAGKNGQRT